MIHMKRFATKDGRQFVTRDGKRIEVGTLSDRSPPKKKRKPFKAQWVKLPNHWIECLERSKCASTYKLALRILREAYKRDQIGGDIILSGEVTWLARQT